METKNFKNLLMANVEKLINASKENGVDTTGKKELTQEEKDKLMSIFKMYTKNTNGIFNQTYEQKVAKLIRKKYSINDEFAILRQRDTKPEEFAEYNAYCEECKTKVKNGEF